jgi:hypothetical protein
MHFSKIRAGIHESSTYECAARKMGFKGDAPMNHHTFEARRAAAKGHSGQVPGRPIGIQGW